MEEDVKKKLRDLFDDMLTKVGAFKRKTYSDVFEEGYEIYKSLPEEIAALCEEAEEDRRKELVEELALVIPDYALGKIGERSKKEKDQLYVDFNLNMAVYVVPILNYSGNEWCEKIAKRMVELWNEKKVSKLTLSYSTYDNIKSGFKSRLCYITTAVCEHLDKPDDCYELTTLRDYRDHYLMQTEEGRGIVEDYYEIAPGIVMMINMRKDAEAVYSNLYQQYLVPCIEMIEAGENEACQNLYMDMVHNLQKEYLYS